MSPFIHPYKKGLMMKKTLHIHISVENIQESIAFYNAQFQTQVTKVKEDYAQWIVEDMALNFAISTKENTQGINHLGIQYETDKDLKDAQTYFEAHEIHGRVENDANCCYKSSNKYWLKDPSGIIWEHYHSSADIEVFGDSSPSCCVSTDSEPPSNGSDSCCPTTAGCRT